MGKYNEENLKPTHKVGEQPHRFMSSKSKHGATYSRQDQDSEHAERARTKYSRGERKNFIHAVEQIYCHTAIRK